MTATRVRKPCLTLAASRLFHEIIAYVKQYKLCKRRDTSDQFALENAASDVMDGLCRNSDANVKELRAKGIIRAIAGSWILTEYAMNVICPE
jgi:hypothetical protein